MKREQLVKAFDRAAGYRYQQHEVFGFFLDTILHQIGLPQFEVKSEDAELLELLEELSRAYGQALAANPPFCDLLGHVYEELGSRGQKKWMGQFFTPWELSQLMAQMTLGDCAIEKPDGELIRVLEPACGAGVTVLAAIDHVIRIRGRDALRGWGFTLMDLDRTCARMAAVQIMANLIFTGTTAGEVIVWRADTLRMEMLELIVHAGARPVTTDERAVA